MTEQAKTFRDRVKCPMGHSIVVATRRVATAGRVVQTYCRMCSKAYQIKAGPVPMPKPIQAEAAPKMMPRLVVCAANRYGELVFLGVRHFCPAMRQNMMGHNVPAIRKLFGEEQGFIDQYGVFMGREEAWAVAEAAGQIRRRVGGDGKKLFSENLY